MRPLASCLALLLCGSVASCAIEPDRSRPVVSVPDHFSTGSGAVSDEALARWWSTFGDPTLDRLVARALTGNLDVARAAARIRQARAQRRIVAANHRPLLNATAGTRYNRISENAIPDLPGTMSEPNGGDNPLLALPGADFTTFETGFDSSWEIDLFGKSRRENEAASARVDAAIWSARDAQLLLVAAVGNAYFHYRALQQKIASADLTLITLRDLLDLAQARLHNGIATTIEVRQREQEIAADAARRESLLADRDARLHELAVLLGEAPLALADELTAPANGPVPDIRVPIGLPSDLLLRRPDIRASEMRLAASAADVGAARADLFPTISLTGALQLVSTSLASLVSADSLQASMAARISAPIFDGGRRRATVELRSAQQHEAEIDYHSRVLEALRDVEDALSRLDAERRRERERAASETAARDAADTARIRYRRGLTDKDDLAAAQLALLESQDAHIDTSAAVTTALIALYKALGGGWELEEPKDG